LTRIQPQFQKPKLLQYNQFMAIFIISQRNLTVLGKKYPLKSSMEKDKQ